MSQLKQRKGGAPPKKAAVETSKKSEDEATTPSELTLLERYPLLQGMIETGVINICGTLLSQAIMSYNRFDSSKSVSAFDISKDVTFDWWEVTVMGLIAMFFIAPVISMFFTWLNNFTTGGLVGKIFVDQFLFGPVFTACIIGLRLFFYSGLALQEIPSMLVGIVPTAQKTAWIFWIPARVLVLLYVPVNKHMLCGNLLSLVWGVIFTMILSN
jgi:hypothetical protein